MVTFSTVMVDILLLVIAILFHELGHYIAFCIYHLKPTVKFKWYAIEVTHPLAWNLTPRQYSTVLLTGLLVGWLFIPMSGIMQLVYIILCSADINNIYQMSSYVKSKKTLLQINKDNVYNAEKEMRDYTRLNKTKWKN